jgi:hypothetical protein
LKFPLYLSMAVLLAGGIVAPACPQIPSGREVVSPAAFASAEPVARGAEFQAAVVLKIREGFHINSRQPSADYLIKTDLKAESAAGFKIGEVSYPQGGLRSFSFSTTPLNVYEGRVVLRMGITALPGVSLGAHKISAKLRYQACSKEICLPPVTVDVELPVTVASSAKESRPQHPELFQSPR